MTEDDRKKKKLMTKEKRKLKTRLKMAEDLKVKRSLFQTRHTILSIFYTKSICIKSCMYIIGSLSIILKIQIEDLSL